MVTRMRMKELQANGYTFARITHQILDYVNGRRQQDEALSHILGWKVADMPMLMQLKAVHPRIQEVIDAEWIDTATAECHGLRKGKSSYEAWHSVSPIATGDGLENLI